MAARDDIKVFLEGNIPTQLAAVTTLPATDSYVGQQERINPADIEVRVQYLWRERIRRDTGNTRHHLTLHPLVIGWDESEEDGTLVQLIEDIAETLVNSYDGQVNLFNGNLANVTVHRVRATRETGLALEGRIRRHAAVSLQVDELEA